MSTSTKVVLALVGLICIAGLAASCQKRSLPASSAGAIESELAKNPKRVPEAMRESAEGQPAELEPPRLVMGKLHDAFMLQGPKMGYEYVLSTDSLKGDKIPGGTMVIEELIRQYYQKYGPEGNVEDPTYRAQSVANFLEDPTFPLKTLQDIAKEQAAAEIAKQAESNPAVRWDDALTPMQRPVGDWRSIREVRTGSEKYEVKHDDKYYKMLMIQAEKMDATSGKVILMEFTGGEQTIRIEQPFTYAADSGELTFIGDSGSPLMILQLKQMATETDILYAKAPEEFIYTVYERVGTGGAEMDAEEAARRQREFEEAGGGIKQKGKDGG